MNIRIWAGAVSAIGLSAVICLTPANAQSSSSTNLASEATNAAVHNTIETARDQFYYQSKRSLGSRSMGFSNDPSIEDSFNALGYRPRDPKSPLFTKAPPAPAANSIQTSIWGSGSGTFEQHDQNFQGFDAGSRSSTGTGLVGVDFLKTSVFTGSDAFLFGVLGGYTQTRTDQIANVAKIQSPTVGAYFAYIAGEFSTDIAFTTSFNHTKSTDNTFGGSFSTDQTSYNITNNFNYRVTLRDNWWVEPTVGYSYTYGAYGDAEHLLFFEDTRTWRVQGGARFGTDFMWNTVRVEPSFYVGAYNDVWVRPTTFGPPNEEGKTEGKVSAKLNFAYTNNVSFYVQGEVHGREDNVGESGTLGVRYSF